MAQELQKKYNNFRVISEESVKQWILACDKIYTGNSSVVVEAFFAKKMCQLLFPLPTTPGFELQLITDSNKITTYEEFYKSLFDSQEKFPTPTESIEDIYLIDWETANYVKFADMAEEVLQNDYYRLTGRQLREYKEYGLTEQLMRSIIAIKPLYNMYLSLLNNEKIKWNFLNRQRKVREKNQKAAMENEIRFTHELTSEEEISRIIERIRYAIGGNENE